MIEWVLDRSNQGQPIACFINDIKSSVSLQILTIIAGLTIAYGSFALNVFLFFPEVVLSQFEKIFLDLRCFYWDGISHNEDIMQSFQMFIVVSFPTTLPI